MGVCLLIHGFTGTPYEVQPLADRLRAEGYQVVTPLLAGHGGTRQDMERTTWVDWIRSAERVLVDLFRQEQSVHLIGFSMGGLIAAYLAVKYANRVRSLTLLSAAVFMGRARQMLRHIAEAVQETVRTKQSHDDLTRYINKMKNTPLRAVVNFRRLVRAIKPVLPRVQVPVLILQGELDELVEPRSALYLYEIVQSKTKYVRFLPKSKHMVCHDCEAEQLMRWVVDFLRERDKSYPSPPF
jgi:carboxylesterase